MKAVKKPRVCGRVKGVEVTGHDRTMIFELRKDGMRVREKGTRLARADVIPFERLASGAGHEVMLGIPERKYRFTFMKTGIEVRRAGVDPAIIPYERLINETNTEPFLFSEMAVYKPKET